MINLDKLTDLLGNDKQVIGRFLDLYLEKVPELIELLGIQLNEKKYSAANITAHEIKSQSAYLNIIEIVECSALIEGYTETRGNENLTSELYLELKQLVNDAVVEIRIMR